MKSPVPYYGGKQKLAPKLLKLLPPHRAYVEVFGGGGALLFAKSPSPLEVYNDLDRGLVSFWQVVRDENKYQRLQMLLELTPYARAEYYDCRETWDEQEDDVERARQWFVKARMGVDGARNRQTGWSYNIDADMRTSAWLSAVKLLPEVHRRLQRVQVDCRDWREIVACYDTIDTLFYFDPPYVLSTRAGGKRYTHELTDEDHRELVGVLLQLQGKALLSGYQHEIYQPIETAGWQRFDFQQATTAAGRNRANKLSGAAFERTECVWLSPSAQTTQLPLTYDEALT